ncbi:MAG: hypothetical protein CMJ83_12280 [Planctomycetes bacterium]|jgi:hypothetical protein|nr:hypothetical protein [Planctomycetota bacterium]
MGRAELIILLSIVLVGASAFALETLDHETVRIVGIGACLLLISLMVVGMVYRGRVRRRRTLAARREGASDGATAS